MVFLLHGLLIITITIQLITAEETYSTTEFQLLNSTDFVLNEGELDDKPLISEKYVNSCNDINITCLTELQLVLLEEAVIRVSLAEIDEGNLESLWDFLKKINPGEEQPVEKIIKRSVQKYANKAFNTSTLRLNSCFGNGFLKLIQFVNQSSNRNWKLAGYQTLFSEISFNTTTNQTLSLFLNLQHYVSQDELIDTDADFKSLLNNIELLIDDFNQSSQDLFGNSDSHCGRPLIHFEYLIKRICSVYPNKILQLWNEIWMEHSLEVFLQFISALEKNNRINYTLPAVPYIKGELYSTIDNDLQYNKTCDLRRQLHIILQTLPKSGTLRKLLSRNEFYIKNAYNQQYLYIKNIHSYKTEDRRIFTMLDRNHSWTVEASQYKYPKNIIEIVDRDNRILIGMQKCEVHDEWYATGIWIHRDFDFEARWITEIVENDKLRLQNGKSGEYLRVGRENVVSTSNLNEYDRSKFEWILESVQNEDYFDKEYECRFSDRSTESVW